MKSYEVPDDEAREDIIAVLGESIERWLCYWLVGKLLTCRIVA